MSKPKKHGCLSWNQEPMNKWYPSRMGKLVMDARELDRREAKSVEERVFNNVTFLCSINAVSISEMAQRLLGIEVSSIDKLSYYQAASLLEEYTDENACFAIEERCTPLRLLPE